MKWGAGVAGQFFERRAALAFPEALNSRALAESNAELSARVIDQLSPSRRDDGTREKWTQGHWKRGQQWRSAFSNHLAVAPESAIALAPRVIERVATGEGLYFASLVAMDALAHQRQRKQEAGWSASFELALAAASRGWSQIAKRSRESLGPGQEFNPSERLQAYWADPSHSIQINSEELALGLVAETFALHAIARDWKFLSAGARERVKAALSQIDPALLDTTRYALTHCSIVSNPARQELEPWLDGLANAKRDAGLFEDLLALDPSPSGGQRPRLAPRL